MSPASTLLGVVRAVRLPNLLLGRLGVGGKRTTVVRRYLSLLAEPAARRSLLAVTVMGLPISLLPLALLLVGSRGYGSYLVAGVFAAGYLAAYGCAAGLQERLARHYGVRTVLIFGGGMGFAVIACVAVVVLRSGWHPAIAVVPIIALGLTSPQPSLVLPYFTTDAGRPETTQTTAVAGLILGAVLAGVGSPLSALATGVVAAGAAAILVAFDDRLPARAPSYDAPSDDPPERVATLIVALIGLGVLLAVGATAVGVVRFAHASAGSGWLLAAWGVGLVAASGVRWPAPETPLPALRWAVAAAALAPLPLLLAAKPVTLFLLLIAAGAATAPVFTYGLAAWNRIAGALTGRGYAACCAAFAVGIASAGAVAQSGSANTVFTLGAGSLALALFLATLVGWTLSLPRQPTGRHRHAGAHRAYSRAGANDRSES